MCKISISSRAVTHNLNMKKLKKKKNHLKVQLVTFFIQLKLRLIEAMPYFWLWDDSLRAE